MHKLPSFDRVPRAVAIDLDGTLLDSRSRLSARNTAAVGGCVARGLPVVIATSRPARSVRRLVGDELVQACSLVLQNGAVTRGTIPLYGTTVEALSPQIVKGIVEFSLSIQPNARVVVETGGDKFAASAILDPVRLWEVNSATPDMVLSMDEAMAIGPTKVAINGMGCDLSEVADGIAGLFGEKVSIIRADGMTFLNIVGPNVSKPVALQHLLQSNGMTLADVLAFGDDIPDVDMLCACGFPVAVANACDEVMAVARFRTASNDDDGVALVLERLLGYL